MPSMRLSVCSNLQALRTRRRLAPDRAASPARAAVLMQIWGRRVRLKGLLLRAGRTDEWIRENCGLFEGRISIAKSSSCAFAGACGTSWACAIWPRWCPKGVFLWRTRRSCAGSSGSRRSSSSAGIALPRRPAGLGALTRPTWRSVASGFISGRAAGVDHARRVCRLARAVQEMKVDGLLPAETKVRSS